MKIIKSTDNKYPKRLLNIKNPPEKLYVKGNEELLNNNSIAIVGSRKCTSYGIKYTKDFANEISKNNITIVSGLAIGIDTIAHKYSKSNIGKTIAVVACGLDTVYPKENKELFNEIIEEGGCIISEYPEGTKVDMKNFPKRNRIISGISMGVLVIEAAYRSGSTIAARYGFEQDKKVFCIPRNIGEVKGVGTNNLIKEGAFLVTHPNEILEKLEIINNEKNNNDWKNEEKTLEEISDKLNINDEYIDIYNLIPYYPVNIEYISKKSNLKISEINQKLIMLELQGYIKNIPGNNYVRI